MEVDSEEFSENTVTSVKEEAEQAINQLLPKYSKVRYEGKYHYFKEWCVKKNVKKINENVLLAYFKEKTENLKYSSLWALYSMLKSTIAINDNTDISNYNKLKTFIKRQADSYQPKKANIFLREEINKFIIEAPDDKYLMLKVVLVMGLAGACRCQELTDMRVEDVKQTENILIVNIPNTKHNKKRTFIVSEHAVDCINAIDLFTKYKSLRPANITHNRLFIGYRNGKCTVQPVGINTISKIPTQIAAYLKLNNPQAYTGHSFRRTSAILLVNEGGDLLKLKQHTGWKSSTVAKRYMESSMCTKTNTANTTIHGQGPHQLQYNTNNIASSSNSFIFLENKAGSNKPNIINYGSNSTINININ